MDRVKKFLMPAIIVAGVAIFALSGRPAATDADYTLERAPEVIAATFSSAWCSACKILEPRLADVIPTFADAPVRFVKLNFTFGETDALARHAANASILDAYERFKGATGFTLLIDAETGDIIDMLTMDHSKPAMRAAIAQALAVASQNGAET